MALVLLAGGCGKSSPKGIGKVVVAVDVPVTGSPYIAQTIRHGVELAASNLNGGGGILVGTHRYRLVVKLYDNHLSARQAFAGSPGTGESKRYFPRAQQRPLGARSP